MAAPNLITAGYQASLWMQREAYYQASVTQTTSSVITSTSLTLAAGASLPTGLDIGSKVTATGIPDPSYVTGWTLSGTTYTIYINNAATLTATGTFTYSALVTPLTNAQLSVFGYNQPSFDRVAGIVGASAGGTGQRGILIPAESVPTVGFDDAVASYSIAGARISDKIPAQMFGTDLQVSCIWNPNDPAILTMIDDAESGQTERTFVMALYNSNDTTGIYYAFNGKIGGWQIDSQPNAEAKAMFTIHPRSLYGWSTK